MSDPELTSECVLVLLTNSKDAERTVEVLATAGLQAVTCADAVDLALRLTANVGVILLSEEAILADTERRIHEALLDQPAWSSIPVVAVVREGVAENRHESLLSDFATNVTLIERPVRMRTMISVVRAALRARRHQYEVRDAAAERELALDAARLGWWRFDPSTGIVTHDARYAEIYGLSGRSRPVEEISPLLHPDDLPRVWESVQAAINPADPKRYAVEYRVNRPDGSLRWLEARGLASFVGEGDQRQVVSFVGTVADVTDRRQTEAALRESEERFRRALEIETVGVLFFDTQGGITEANDAFLRMGGYDREDLRLGRLRWDELTPPEWMPASLRAVEEFTALGRTTPYEKEYYRKDGSRFSALFAARRIAEHEGVEFVLDITDRKQAEFELRKKTDRLNLLLDNIHDYAVIISDRDDVVVEWLGGAEAITGFTASEMLGRTADVIFTSQDRAAGRPVDELKKAAESGRAENVRWHLRKDGSRFFAEGVTVALRDDAGQLRGFGKVFRDATAQKEFEEALRDADRKKDQFLATLAHELRNPLAPISNALEVWSLIEEDPAEAERVREMMGRQVRQLTRLIDDLMDVSRISRGKIELRKERLDLAAIVERSVEAMRPLIDSCHHELSVSLPTKPVFLEGDATRLVQLIGNLVHNAAKYTGQHGRIWITTKREGDEAVVSIRDNGPGIPPGKLSAIFEMFTQIDETITRSHGGLGIGLTLVKNLVELHGGTIQAISEGLGKGSEFIVRLPGERSAEMPSAVPPATHPEPVRLKTHRVLVVDDIQPSANTLAMMFKRLDQVVRTAYDGPSALILCEEFRPEIVILDIAMPVMDGYEVARRIRRIDGLDAVLVALTGYGQEEDRRKALEAGFNHHLIKPTTVEALRELLRKTAR